jgi:DNA-binding Lrp family transcriptional regulator
MDLAELDPDERAFWERYILTGIHAFLFVDHVAGDKRRNDIIKDDLIPLIPKFPPSDGDEPFSVPVVLSASEFVGSFGAFVHLWAPPGQLAALQDFIGVTLWDLGVRCNYATQGTSYQGPDHIYPMKVKKCDVVAVVRIWVKKGSAAGAVLSRLAKLPGFQGAATVFGDFDVLLVLEGEDYRSVAEIALGELQSIHGIKRTESAFADYRRYDES